MTLLDERPVAADVSTHPGPTSPPGQKSAVMDLPITSRRAHVAEQLRMVRLALRATVVITVLIACGSFFLSFWSLWDLASQLAWPSNIAWVWPLIVDGMIIVATMALVALGGYDEQKKNRVYCWFVLGFGALVSMSANFIHPLLPHLAGQEHTTVTAGAWLGAAMSCIPPIALLICTHILAILYGFAPDDDSASPPAPLATPVSADLGGGAAELSRAVAAGIHARGKLTGHSQAVIAEMVLLLFHTQPALTLREIGRRVDRHHDIVSKVRDETSALLGVGVAAGGAK